jgi:endonuclease-3
MAKPFASRRLRVEQARAVTHLLQQHYGTATCALVHASPYELLAATILSAQCTDERVNLVTPDLFAKYPTVEHLAEARVTDVAAVVRSTGFFQAKAANLIGMAQAVVQQHGGRLPQTLDELVQLPGVGRKTANVLLGTAFGIAAGVVVDTHVRRITQLLGLTESDQPEKIELDLMQLLPANEWINFSHRLIHHGRRICIARRPQCSVCPLLAVCRRVGLPALPRGQRPTPAP